MMVDLVGNIRMVVVADDEHDRLEDPVDTASISHHHHQNHQYNDSRVVIKVEDDDEENSSVMIKTTEASTAAPMIKSLSTLGVKLNQYNSTYSSRGELLRDHHREYGFDCPLCSKKFIGIVDMRAHLDRHYPRDSPICPVSSCQKIFSHPNSVRNHMRLKHSVQWDKIKALRWTYV
ncbi:hypothetical protein PV327_005122 [Microctonus hyperodae]|uniref:C2H2-type domain-containing protein n=1 Tax=Microctonus hyperodae TaxID=165561 RepID=A0AA39KZD3_MICHY|nr:hypothetical protein PV327_005122 [Microctonus hyperodae]